MVAQMAYAPYAPDKIMKRSQDLQTYYHDAGLFYWDTAQRWNTNPDFFNLGRPYILPTWRVQDIDTLEDWKRAELMYKVLSNDS